LFNLPWRLLTRAEIENHPSAEIILRIAKRADIFMAPMRQEHAGGTIYAIFLKHQPSKDRYPIFIIRMWETMGRVWMLAGVRDDKPTYREKFPDGREGPELAVSERTLH
jgi:hypothetical protein